MGTPQFLAEPARRLPCRFDRWQNRRSSSARLPGRGSRRSYILPHHLFSEPHLHLSRQPYSERCSLDDRESRDLVPAALSLEHWWGTRESIRNMGSHRETSSLYEAGRV